LSVLIDVICVVLSILTDFIGVVLSILTDFHMLFFFSKLILYVFFVYPNWFYVLFCLSWLIL
jgi:hypothetical protein